jgi:hypothetical protein
MDSVVKFSAVVSCLCCPPCTPVGSAQRTIKGRHAAVDQLITSNGFGTTLWKLGGGGGPL